MRRQNSHLQAFVEGFMANCPKNSPWEYRFLLTTKILTTLRNLSFSGNDPDKRWQAMPHEGHVNLAARPSERVCTWGGQ
jgi:hypothetical protein